MKLNSLFLVLLICTLFFTTKSFAQIEDIKVGTSNRKMLVYAPPQIEEDRPLLLSLHGLNQDIFYQQSQTQWETIAKANNFVLVYPGGINNSWDISGTRDTDFILAIIDEMYNRYGIDRDRVYLSGFSMGGMMTYHAATKIADKIAAFAPVSGYLMGGPNTNSSRPIPIIHTHGTADDVVPFSGVQTCLNAWIKRNDCPETPVVTQPYPANKPSSSGTKYYWGKGADSVEVVLMCIEGTGHWHSINPNGVNTSQEIWNFCKKYSLDWGIPKVKLASVTEENPQQVIVDFNLPLQEEDDYQGFIVRVDNQVAEVSGVALIDSTRLAISLSDGIQNSEDVVLAYNDGNVVSIYGKVLAPIESMWVENLLYGASPRLTGVATNETGDTLFVSFNKKMQLPMGDSIMMLIAENDENIDIPLHQGSFYKNDSTSLAFAIEQQVYADYNLSLAYSGDKIVAVDSGMLKPFSNYPVTNNAKGLPVQIIDGETGADGLTLILNFSKSMALLENQLGYFTLKVNSSEVPIDNFSVYNNKINFVLASSLHYGDPLSVSYSPGDVTAADGGPLEAFSNIEVENRLNAPSWINVPGKIEAENYTLQHGTDTEQTGDTGGGTNVGWIEDGDWLEYAIENISSETEYMVTFRVASPNTGGRLSYSIDGEEQGRINIPNTGNWQSYRSVDATMTLPGGKHYLKLEALKGGFNINYLNVYEDKTGKEIYNEDELAIYPNPVKNEMIINASGFKHNKVEIFNEQEKLVLGRATNSEEQLNIQLNLVRGVYIVKLSSDNRSLVQKIVVEN